MCGIIGQVSFNKVDTAFLSLDSLSHRGPDGRGEWTNLTGNVYFGHTRLAILEPTPAGKQPMQDASNRVTVTFNGEIYNHLLLRSLLPGIKWRGTSDTETLVELLASKGLQALCLLKGMFAFVMHDAADGSVTVVRDRFGIKPLWLKYHDGAYSFASEIRALFQPGDNWPTKSALAEYIGFGHLPGSGEVFKGIYAVPPGYWFRLQAGGKLQKVCWWPAATFTSLKQQSRHEHVKQVKKLVTTAIEEHLISDVGVGAFLSGGIDSSIVTLVAGQALGKRLKTFTVGFPEAYYDERSVARVVAKQAGSEHYELVVPKDTCLNWVQEAVQKLDVPSVDAINTYIVSKAVRDTGLKVALSGLGGDELFGGYPSFKSVPLLSWLRLFPSGVSERLIALMPQRLKEKLGNISDFTTTELAVARRRFVSVTRLKAMGLGGGTPAIAPVPSGLDKMGQISWAEIQGYMIPMLLRDSDQMSMAVGLEIRVPFLDHQLVEDVLGIPQKFKKGKGIKPLLIEAFKAELPSEVYDRPKQGFVLPMQEWIRGPLAEFTNEGVLAAADLLGLSEPVQEISNFKKSTVHWTRIWKWCVLGYWLLRKDSEAQIQNPPPLRSY